MKKSIAWVLCWVFHLFLILISFSIVTTSLAQKGEGYTVTEIQDGGATAGVVRFAGKVPEPKPLNIHKDKPECGKCPKFDETLVVDAQTNGIQNVVVSLKRISAGKAWDLPEKGSTFLFSINATSQSELDSKHLPEDVRQAFGKNKISLSQNPTVLVEQESSRWRIGDRGNQIFRIKKEEGKLNVYGWALDQNGCQFKPHVLVIPVNRPFYILNNDNISHNMHTYSRANPAFNKIQPKYWKALEFNFEHPETIRIRCDIHNWMQAWIVATAHPYYTVTDAKGYFELTNIPPGAYTLEFWHESLGQQSRSVEVKPNETTRLELTLSGSH